MTEPCPYCGGDESLCDFDWRTDHCSQCKGEGRILSGHPNNPHPTDHGACPSCDGTGREMIATSPIEMDDLDQINGH